MRRLVILLGLILAAPLAAHAQRFDLFGGYTYARFEQQGGDTNTNGWAGSITYKFSPYLGLEGAFTGNYGTLFKESASIHNFYVGPQLSLPMRRYSPFVHVLLGVMRLSVPALKKSAFSTEVGGGLDIRANDYLSIRVIEADVVTGDLTSTSSDGRICAGVVLHF